MTGPSNKRQKREAYRKAQEGHNGGVDTGRPIDLPKKKFYRQRAHANPFSDHALVYPASPADMDWSRHYPAYVQVDATTAEGTRPLSKQVEIADIGCGFGGLLVALSPLLPDTLMIGMELRIQVLSYVTSRIAALRSQHQTLIPCTDPSASTPTPTVPGGPYQNISALRNNTMKFLPNYFTRGQLSKLFLCFPDPHFKARKHKARIVSMQLGAEYAYVMRPGGLVYTITDVEELHGWMVRHFEGVEAGDGKELWKWVSEEELERQGDVCLRVMREETEEGKKVSRNGGRKFVAVWRRREDPAWPE